MLMARWPRLRLGGRGTVALEFALVAVPMLGLLLFVLEISFDLYTKSVLDAALQLAARQVQTGNAQNAKSGADFITSYLCPDLGGLLQCSNVFVKVQRISPTSGQDYYDFTTGVPPETLGQLDLSSFGSASFCNSGPSQLLLVSAVYVGPTIVGSLIPTGLSITYNGGLVHATLSTVGVVSENYATAAAAPGTASPC